MRSNVPAPSSVDAHASRCPAVSCCPCAVAQAKGCFDTECASECGFMEVGTHAGNTTLPFSSDPALSFKDLFSPAPQTTNWVAYSNLAKKPGMKVRVYHPRTRPKSRNATSVAFWDDVDLDNYYAWEMAEAKGERRGGEVLQDGSMYQAQMYATVVEFEAGYQGHPTGPGACLLS